MTRYSYFSALDDNLGLAANLPVDSLHIDLVRAPQQLAGVLDRLPPYKVLSLGVVNGRNVWRCDLEQALQSLWLAAERFGERLWVVSSCSLLHSPMDLAQEDRFDEKLKGWLAFAVQKCQEVAILARAVEEPEALEVRLALADSRAARETRRHSPRIHKLAVQARRRSPSVSAGSAHSSTCRRFLPPPSAPFRRLWRSARRARPIGAGRWTRLAIAR